MPTGAARQFLRSATARWHRRVDAAFAGFELSRSTDYRRFLSAHARAVPALEAAIARGTPWSGWSPASLALTTDLRDVGSGSPPAMAYAGDNGEAALWGVQYVLEGSRLGARLLIRQLPVSFPQRYLAGRADGGDWLAFQRELDGAATDKGRHWLAEALESACAAFDMFDVAVALELETVE